VRALTVALVLTVALDANAQCRDSRWPRADGPEPTQRLHALSRLFTAEATRASRWTAGWALGYTALTLGQLLAVPALAAEDRPDWYLGAASSAVGVAFVLIDPLEVRDAAEGFSQRAARATSPEEVCALLVEGEGLLERSADHEVSGRKWYVHAANVAFNLGVGLLIGLGFKHWGSAALNAAMGIAIGEGTIFTSPTHLASAWSDYQRGALEGDGPAVSFNFAPQLLRGGAGLSLSGSF
jgi:hypothetical protein